ncbi:MAG: hypothetical protein RIQ89_1998 [Bacteroidota bacterium]|jgi:cell division protein FtsB
MNKIADTDVQEHGPKKSIVIVVIAILLGTNGLLLWQFFDKKNRLDQTNQQLITTTQEKENLQRDLDKVRMEHEKMKSENLDLHNQLTSKDEEIASKVAEIQKLIAAGGPAQIAKAKAELAKLREMNAVYLAQIDSLNTVNKSLVADKEQLTSNLNTEKNRTESLSKENQNLSNQVNAGSVLLAERIITEAVRIKSSGKNIPTLKAKQVQQIHTKFTLLRNSITRRGTQEIFVRVLGPDGGVMSSNQEAINVNGQQLVYTMKQNVEYAGTDTEVDAVWAKGSNFTPGKYKVELYHASSLIGSSTIELK